MKISFITLYLISVFFIHNSFSQMLPNEQQILVAVFDDDRVFKEVFTNKYNNKNSIYIYVNNRILSHINDYEKVALDMTPENGGAGLLFSSKRGFVRIFSDPVMVNAITKFGIDKVVVFESFAIKKGSATLSFHTTNLDSKAWHKNNNSMANFFKFNCSLNFNGSEWKITKIDITDFRFKPLE